MQPSAARIDVEVSEDQVVFRFGDRQWRVRGLSKNLSVRAAEGERAGLARRCVLRGPAGADERAVSGRASWRKQRRSLEREERVLKSDLGRVFLKLEELQDAAIQKQLEPKTKPAAAMSEGERNEALALLA